MSRQRKLWYKFTRYPITSLTPHGAVGYLGLKQYQKSHTNTYGVFLETAHPVKFLDIVEETIDTTLEIPSQIQKVMGKEKKSIKINTYGELKAYLINSH